MTTSQARVTVNDLVETLGLLGVIDGFPTPIPEHTQEARAVVFHTEIGGVRMTPARIRAMDGSWQERLTGSPFDRVVAGLRAMEHWRVELLGPREVVTDETSGRWRHDLEVAWSGAILGDGYYGPVVHLDIDDASEVTYPYLYPRRGWNDEIDSYEPRPITADDAVRLALWLRDLLDGTLSPGGGDTLIGDSIGLLLHEAAPDEFDVSIILETEPSAPDNAIREIRVVADRYQVEESAAWWQAFAVRMLMG